MPQFQLGGVGGALPMLMPGIGGGVTLAGMQFPGLPMLAANLGTAAARSAGMSALGAMPALQLAMSGLPQSSGASSGMQAAAAMPPASMLTEAGAAASGAHELAPATLPPWLQQPVVPAANAAADPTGAEQQQPPPQQHPQLETAGITLATLPGLLPRPAGGVVAAQG